MENLPDEVIYEILYFLDNEHILKMIRINKKINRIMGLKSFKEEIIYRDHPVVFNILDNMCELCNFKTILLDDMCYFSICNHY